MLSSLVEKKTATAKRTFMVIVGQAFARYILGKKGKNALRRRNEVPLPGPGTGECEDVDSLQPAPV